MAWRANLHRSVLQNARSCRVPPGLRCSNGKRAQAPIGDASPRTAEFIRVTSVPMLPRLLVILASHNGASWIEQQLQSVLAQTQVAVVFTSLTIDPRMERLKSSARWRKGRVRVEFTECKVASGSAQANFMRAIRAAVLLDANYVAFCDQDDVWADDKLAVACGRLAETRADLYSSAVTAVWPDGRSKRLTQSSKWTSLDFLFEEPNRLHLCSDKGALRARPELRHDECGRCCQDPLHDWLIYALAQKLGQCLGLRPEASYRVPPARGQ